MAQQTAVEWLQIKMATSSAQEMVENINVWIKQAKQMEKEQIIDAYIKASPRLEDIIKEAAEQYYTKTYNK